MIAVPFLLVHVYINAERKMCGKPQFGPEYLIKL